MQQTQKTFLAGKKKYSIPVIAALVMLAYALAGVEPPPEIAQWSLGALGGLYLLVEGARDIIRQWQEGKSPENPSSPDAAPPVAATPAAGKAENPPIAAPAAGPVDWAGFNEDVLARAKQDYGDVDQARPNMIARFYATRAAGAATPCPSMLDALTYSDVYTGAAEQAFAYLWGFPIARAVDHLGDDDPQCPYTSVDSMARRKGKGYYAILREVRRACRKANDLEALQEMAVPDSEIKKLADQSLYGVMELAGQLIPQPAPASAEAAR